MSIPYTYLIGWTNHNKWYYGVRYAVDCHPSELWVTYFTSSKYVKTFRSNFGEPDVVTIRKIFSDSTKAKLWESAVLRKMCVSERPDFLNKAATDQKFINTGHTEETKQKLSDAAKRRPKISEETKKKMSISALKLIRNPAQTKGLYPTAFAGRTHSKETRQKMSIARTGYKPSAESIEKAAAFHRGRTRSYETKIKISEGAKKSYALRMEKQ
jgi:hypothetical protein